MKMDLRRSPGNESTMQMHDSAIFRLRGLRAHNGVIDGEKVLIRKRIAVCDPHRAIILRKDQWPELPVAGVSKPGDVRVSPKCRWSGQVGMHQFRILGELNVVVIEALINRRVRSCDGNILSDLVRCRRSEAG